MSKSPTPRYERLRLSPRAERVLLEEAALAELNGQLTPAQLNIIRDEGWFRMFVPESLGGAPRSLPEALAIEETLAAIDGSLGWTVTLCSGAGLFAGFAAPELQQELFTGPDICIGGSGMASGTAERVAGGYRVNGSWRFATGAPHLTGFSANCVITENGKPLKDDEGRALIRSFLFEPDEVVLRRDWNVSGLIATASWSYSVTDITLPEWRSFLIRPQAATDEAPVYRYPFLQFAELTLAANFGGMGLGFLDAFREGLVRHSDGGARQAIRERALETAEASLNGLLVEFHETAASSWRSMTANVRLDVPELERISVVSRGLASGVRSIVTELYPFAGLEAATPGSRINRVWRDIFTGTQHSLLNYPA